jgi:hypothetical protein
MGADTFSTAPSGLLLPLAYSLALGVLFGVPEWLVLRRYYRVSHFGLLLSPLMGVGAVVAGFATGLFSFPATVALFHSSTSMNASLVVGGLSGGAVVGVFQSLLLMHWLREPVWIAVASGLGGALFVLAAVALGPQAILGGLLGGLVYALATGPVLEWQRINGSPH